MNANTGAPMQGASVFAQNTTIGTATNEEGIFQLTLPNGGYDLIVTYTGFVTSSKRVTAADADNRNLIFVMNEKNNDLEDLIIVASNEVKDGLEKYGDFFRENFLGQTVNSRNCKILNEEVLKFYYYKKSNRLKVLAPEPLEIENKALGYTIKYSLDSFVHQYNDNVSIYTGYPLYEEMQTEDSVLLVQWSEARNDAYKGSTLHFMRSVYNKSLKNQGFEIQQLYTVNGDDKMKPLPFEYAALHYKKDSATLTVQVRPDFPRLGVIYKAEKPTAAYLSKFPKEPSLFQFSVLGFTTREPMVIEQNGYYYDQFDLVTSGYWGWEKVADALPYDYKPKK